MKLNKIIQDLKIYINDYEEAVLDPKEDERYKYAVSMLGYLEELKHLRVVNKNISRELITRTDKLTNKKDEQIIEHQKKLIDKVNKEAQKYFDLLMDDEKVINEMADFIFENVDTAKICGMISSNDCFVHRDDCNGCIIEYFRKKCM